MSHNHFQQLHQQSSPLLLCNVWDAMSANSAKKLGFEAIGTSSAAIAAMLGYEDGEQMAFSELLYVVQRIKAGCSLPLTVDIEAGYSQSPQVVASHIKALADLGVVGINIEDSRVDDGQRSLQTASAFADRLRAIRAALDASQMAIFINVRTDTFLLGVEDSLNETLTRSRLYQAAGADGLFVPCVTSPADIETIVAATCLPVNVMCMPDLPGFAALERLGVKRVSMGNFLFDKLAGQFELCLADIRQQGDFDAAFR